MGFLKKLDIFTVDGTLTRNEFLSVYFLLMIPTIILGVLAQLTASDFLSWLFWSLYIFNTIIIIFLCIRRLRDLSRSPFLLFLLLLPIANLYIIYLLFLKIKP